jgi:hypothetical protein
MRKRILVAVGVVAVAAAIAVPVVMAAATPSPTVQPAVTAKPVTDDKGGASNAVEPGDDKGKGGDDD